jgi:hypothetical protein
VKDAARAEIELGGAGRKNKTARSRAVFAIIVIL